MAEHSFNHNHIIRLQDTKILSTKTSYTDRLIRESIEIEMHSNNTNREGCFSRSWQPPLHRLKNKRRPETHGRERPASQPSLRIVIQAKPSQSSNWGAETCAKRKSTSTSLLDIPAFDRKAGLKNRHLITNRGICLR